MMRLAAISYAAQPDEKGQAKTGVGVRWHCSDAIYGPYGPYGHYGHLRVNRTQKRDHRGCGAEISCCRFGFRALPNIPTVRGYHGPAMLGLPVIRNQ